METLDLLRQWLQTCPALIGEKVQLDFLGRASGWSVSALKESSAKDILGRRSGTVVIKICRRCLPADDRERAAARAALASVTAWAERSAPGIAEYIRMRSMEVTKRAMLGRGVSVIRKGTLIINLPGSPKAVMESLGFILDSLEHGLKVLRNSVSECAAKLSEE